MTALRWAPPLLFAGLILFLSSQPGSDLPPTWFEHSDKLVHAAVYWLLGALTARAAVRSGRAVVIAALVGCIAFGLFDEWYQQFTPGRASDLADFIADAIGASVGFALVVRYHRRRHVPRHSTLR